MADTSLIRAHTGKTQQPSGRYLAECGPHIARESGMVPNPEHNRHTYRSLLLPVSIAVVCLIWFVLAIYQVELGA